jgi:MSHA biogenesis protein MshO
MHRADLSLHRARGVTLIEMIVAMVVLGILIGVVGMFVRNQVTSYFDVAARTELSDAADSALRRISRELQAALPNSVRVSADSLTLEFVPIRDAGRYRAQRGVPADNHLDFASTTDNSFEVFGPAVTAVNGDSLVVYNLGIPGADVYAGDTRRALTSFGSLNTLAYSVGGTQFPLPSPQNRFQIVTPPVTFRCDLGTGVVRRHAGYGFQAVQPEPPVGGATSILVDGVTACSFAYAPGAQQRNGLVSMRLTLSRNGEAVTLLHQVNVVNTP